jgi:hypothetical protein
MTAGPLPSRDTLPLCGNSIRSGLGKGSKAALMGCPSCCPFASRNMTTSAALTYRVAVFGLSTWAAACAPARLRKLPRGPAKVNWTDRDKMMLCIVGAFGLAVVLIALVYTWARHGVL